MSSLLSRCLLAGFALAAGAAGADAPVTLANAHVEIGVEPAHGLILGFGRTRGRNLLWVNPHPLASARMGGWANYGGDKLWWGPQVDWQAVTGRRFPPDEALDGAWSVADRQPDRVVLRSGLSPWVGVRAEREIALAAGEPAVVIRNRFTRVSAGRQRLQLWTVSQLLRPRCCWLESRPGPREGPFVNLRPALDPGTAVEPDSTRGLVRCTAPATGAYLIGTRGAWIAAVYDDLIVVHQLSPYPDGEYAEQVSLQLFFGQAYIELETLGGLASPAVGQSMANTVRWSVLDRPAGLTDQEIGPWLQQRLAARVDPPSAAELRAPK